MTGPIIIIGTTPLCHGGILSDDLTVPIVAFCSQFFVYVRNVYHPFVYNNSSLCHKHMREKLLLDIYAENNFHIQESVANYKIVNEHEFYYPQM